MTDQPERPHQRELRASDADRERVATVLREAAAEGRLDLGELDERLAMVYAARTYGELEPLLADLPTHLGGPSARHARAGYVAPSDLVNHAPLPPVSTSGIAIMSEFKRKGWWGVGRTFTCLAFWGGGIVDLREAHFPQPEVKIRAFAIMGGIDIIVPEEAMVHVTGVGIMGGFDHGAGGTGTRATPRITVTGLAFWGGVSVKRRARSTEVDGGRRHGEPADGS